MRIETPRGMLQLIGFARAEDAARPTDYIGKSRCVMAAEDSRRSEACIGALTTALHESNRVIIARFVARKNSAPELVCLLPDPISLRRHGYTAARSSEEEKIGRKNPASIFVPRLLMQNLPFSDDIRGFDFPSFENAPTSQQPKEQQVAAAEQVVAAFAIDHDSLRPERTFNPVMQRLRATIVRPT